MNLSLAAVFSSILRHRGVVLAFVGTGLIVSLIVAFLFKPIYRAEVVLLPVSDEAGMRELSMLAGQYSAIAALAGVQLGDSSSRDQALGVLRSDDLLEKFINSRQLLPELFHRKWDAESKAWRENVREPPTIGDALLLFDRKIRQVREDLKSGLVTLRIEWSDRHQAAAWANGLVELANAELQTRAVNEASSALEVLERELDQAESVELREALSRLLEAQLKARTIAVIRKEFAFKIIDPARVADADKRVKPSRTLIAMAGALASFLLAILVVCGMDQHQSRADSR
jgi:uncharacterized protein involved in exopolysaccharide biosynthesis